MDVTVSLNEEKYRELLSQETLDNDFAKYRESNVINNEKLQQINNKKVSDIGNKNEIDLNCPFCSYKALKPKFLKKHITLKHTRLKAKKCPICPFTTLLQEQLKHHAQVEHEDQLKKCQYCDYTTLRISNLMNHIKTNHSNKNLYHCGHCKFKTTYIANLKVHLKTIHKNEKKYSCPMCKYRASIALSLKVHIIAIHEKTKPFKCTACNYRSIQKNTLDKHYIAKHLKVKYKCPQCDYQISRRNYLQRHIKKVHFEVANSKNNVNIVKKNLNEISNKNSMQVAVADLLSEKLLTESGINGNFCFQILSSTNQTYDNLFSSRDIIDNGNNCLPKDLFKSTVLKSKNINEEPKVIEKANIRSLYGTRPKNHNLLNNLINLEGYSTNNISCDIILPIFCQNEESCNEHLTNHPENKFVGSLHNLEQGINEKLSNEFCKSSQENTSLFEWDTEMLTNNFLFLENSSFHNEMSESYLVDTSLSFPNETNSVRPTITVQSD